MPQKAETSSMSTRQNILVACEESQAVTFELRRLGHNAFSCDIADCSGGGLEWHIKQDVLPLLNGNCAFKTCDGSKHSIHGRWDAIIAFPPCTHLAISGAKHFEKKRQDGRQYAAIEFFCRIWYADCDRILIENPKNIIGGKYIPQHFPELAKKYGLPIKQSQMVQPYWFGDHARKATCLWLKNMPLLVPTNMVDPGEIISVAHNKSFSIGASAYYARNAYGKILKWRDPETAKIRSKTYPGIARAIAEQMIGPATCA